MATKTAPEKKAKSEKAPNRAVGKTLGLGVQATWVKVFKNNMKDKKSDAEITKFMNAEFPGRNSAIFNRVQHVRAQYNRGVLTKDDEGVLVIPGQLSARYDDEGNKTTARAGRPKEEAAPAKAEKVEKATKGMKVKKAA